jgi:hypothetical protein
LSGIASSDESIALHARCIRTKRIIGILPIRRRLAAPDCGVRSEINLSGRFVAGDTICAGGNPYAIPIEVPRIMLIRFATCGL